MGMDLDKKALAHWTKTQIAIQGSGCILAKKLGVHQELIRRWRDERVESLTEQSLKKIARYQAETLLQVRALVSGMEVADFVINELKGIPRHLLIEISDRVNDLRSQSDKVRGNFTIKKEMCSPVGRLIIDELNAAVAREDFPDFDAAATRFIEMCNFVSGSGGEEIVRGMLDGRAMAGPNLIGWIAYALREISGNPLYDYYYLSALENPTR
jgi:hypothetical protein